MKDGFLAVRAASPALRVADCEYNTAQILAAMEDAGRAGVRLLCLPELCLTGYTCGDLFLQAALLRGAEAGLRELLRASQEHDMVVLAGLPVAVDGKLYNCAAALARGRLLGLVPKTWLPNYSEFYELRHFSPRPRRGAGADLCRAADAVWLPPAVCLPPDGKLCAGGGAVRGSVGAGAAQLRAGAGGGHRHCQPVGQRRDHRQGGLPPPAGLRPERPAAVRLPVRRRRPRREHHRHGVCRP